MAFENRTAEQMLDMACQAEEDGKHKRAELAFHIALEKDGNEHANPLGGASLPRS